MVYHEKHIVQWYDRSHRCDLCKIRYWTIKTCQIVYSLWRRRERTMTWSIVQVRFTQKIKINYHDRSNRVWSIAKTRQDNDMIDGIDVVYVKIRIELSWPIIQGAAYHKKQIGEWRDLSYRCDLFKKWYWPIKSFRYYAIYDQNETRQRCDQSFKFALHQKPNWTVKTNPIRYGL